MSKSDEQVAIDNIIKRLEKLEEFKEDTFVAIDGINAWIESHDKIDQMEEIISDKNKIIRNFLELNKDIADEDVQRLMGIPMHKREDFQKEDLDNHEKVYWACKILLEYIGNDD